MHTTSEDEKKIPCKNFNLDSLKKILFKLICIIFFSKETIFSIKNFSLYLAIIVNFKQIFF